jgi:septal ring factor EnvC (AmiA/AmiB activator)
VAPAQAEVPEPISLLEQAADRIEALLRQVAALEEVRVSTIRLLDAAEAKATALETELAESRESLARADTRIIELEDNVRQLTVQAEADAKARSRLAALLNPSA